MSQEGIIETGSGVIENPFGKARDERLNVGAVAIESERAIADVKAKLALAKMFPRDRAQAFQQVMDTCSRKEFAETATYSYPRGGETVTGPSIRLAEELARAWGNVEFGIAELAEYAAEPGQAPATEVMAFCWDLQANVMSKQTFRSPHERHTKRGVQKLDDPRDIYENNANLGARRLRSRILAVIPPDMVSAAVRQSRDTLAGNVKEPLSQRVANIVRQFGKLGVAVSHIEQRLGHSLDNILPDEYADLVGIYNSLKDGMTSASDWFNVPKSQAASEKATKAQEAFSKPTDPKPAQSGNPDPIRPDTMGVLLKLYKSKENKDILSGNIALTQAEALDEIKRLEAL